jgi:hypothetical protein
MTVEKTLERKLREGMKIRKGIALKFYCLSFTGMPDRICLAPFGRIWFVELKSTGKKPSKRQDFVHKWLRKMGFEVWTVDTQELLTKFLNNVGC